MKLKLFLLNVCILSTMSVFSQHGAEDGLNNISSFNGQHQVYPHIRVQNLDSLIPIWIKIQGAGKFDAVPPGGYSKSITYNAVPKIGGWTIKTKINNKDVELAHLDPPNDETKEFYTGRPPFLLAKILCHRAKFKGDTAVGWIVIIVPDKKAEEEDRIAAADNKTYKTKLPQVFNTLRVYYPTAFGNIQPHMDTLREASMFSHNSITLGQREYKVLKTPIVTNEFIEYLCTYNDLNCKINLVDNTKNTGKYNAMVTFSSDSSWYYDIKPRE